MVGAGAGDRDRAGVEDLWGWKGKQRWKGRSGEARLVDVNMDVRSRETTVWLEVRNRIANGESCLRCNPILLYSVKRNR